MGKTKIEWTAWFDHRGQVQQGYTFNPWIGCAKISPGCQFCYAERENQRRGWVPSWTGLYHRTSKAYWHQLFQWDKTAAIMGGKARVFIASLADVFDERVPPEWRHDLWELCETTPNLIKLILTKRCSNWDKLLPSHWQRGGNFPQNVWMGFSAENQDWFDRRYKEIRRYRFLDSIPVIWVSAEPLLGSLNMKHFLGGKRGMGIDWVIVGGESGPEARPMSLNWARELIGECQNAETPVFVKQLGQAYGNPNDPKATNPANWAPDLRIQQVPLSHYDIGYDDGYRYRDLLEKETS